MSRRHVVALALLVLFGPAMAQAAGPVLATARQEVRSQRPLPRFVVTFHSGLAVSATTKPSSGQGLAGPGARVGGGRLRVRRRLGTVDREHREAAPVAATIQMLSKYVQAGG